MATNFMVKNKDMLQFLRLYIIHVNYDCSNIVVIYFQISIFEPLETAKC